MTDIKKLIAESRNRTVDHARQNPEGSIDLERRLADALEATAAELRMRTWQFEDAEAVREDNARLAEDAEAERDEALDVIRSIRLYREGGRGVSDDLESEEAFVASSFVDFHTEKPASPGDWIPMTEEEALARWTAWLAEHDRRLQFDAWEEGFDAGELDVIRHREDNWSGPCIPNPYIEKEAGE